MELGLMPASPLMPKKAVHLGLMNFMLNMKSFAVLSSQVITTLCNNLNNNYEATCYKKMSSQRLSITFFFKEPSAKCDLPEPAHHLC
jgi:hypothetical protein